MNVFGQQRTKSLREVDAVGFTEERNLGDVPSYVDEWRARQESNL